MAHGVRRRPNQWITNISVVFVRPFIGNGIVGVSRGGKCMGAVFCGKHGIGQRECSQRSASLVVRREAAAPRRLRKRGKGANSSSDFPCKTSRAFYPDAALPRRCRDSLATALQGVPSAFAGWLVSAPCVGLCGLAAWREEEMPRTESTASAAGAHGLERCSSAGRVD